MKFSLRFSAKILAITPLLLLLEACGSSTTVSPAGGPLTDAASELVPVCCAGDGAGGVDAGGSPDGARAMGSEGGGGSSGGGDAGAGGPDGAGGDDGAGRGDAVTAADGSGGSDGVDGVGDAAYVDQSTFDAMSCVQMATSEAHPIEGASHVDVCSPTPYATVPPSSGNHYGIWAAYRTYTTPVPWGFLVHDLEHGAVVISYNCPAGCASEVAAAQALLDSYPPDPVCGIGPPSRRFVLVPEPDIDVRFAASAWGFTLRSPCFDTTAFKAFIDAHYGQGPEDLCGDGQDPTGGPGGTPLCPTADAGTP